MITASSCGPDPVPTQQIENAPTAAYAPGQFGYDLQFLAKYDSILVLQGEDSLSRVIVSPKYQAKVFTSTSAGNEGASFGWVNYKAFSGPVDAHMNAYGGENRFWLGPEGGKFSLFFQPGVKMEFANWKTPAAYDTEKWELGKHDAGSATLSRDMALENYQGATLHLHAERTISLMDKQDIEGLLGSVGSVRVVGYQTVNRLTNTGSAAWDQHTGAPCMWMLDMLRPGDSTVIVIPFKNEEEKPLHSIATTDYFGEIGGDRLKNEDHVLFLRADGKKRGKLGLLPSSTLGVAGSYDAQKGILTMIFFDVDAKADYLNQEWTTDKPAFSGDAMNAYNDGPLADGSQMGPFYELESVAPAAFLEPGATQVHHHGVIHCTGNRADLDRIAQRVLHVTLAKIDNVFNDR